MSDQPTDIPEIDPSEWDDESLVFTGRPPTAGEEVLAEKFYEQIAGQGAQMDALARQMITVELAVPGLYASILTLLRGDKATLPAGLPLYLTFGLWALALILTFLALFPRRYEVNTEILLADAEATDGVLGIEDHFHQAAQYKWRLLAAAAAAFGGGVLAAVWLLFG